MQFDYKEYNVHYISDDILGQDVIAIYDRNGRNVLEDIPLQLYNRIQEAARLQEPPTL